MHEFDDDAVQRIVRRAVELDADRGDSSHIDRESLIAAATEVGIERSSIELAIAEHQVRPAPSPGRLDRIVGPSQSIATRRIEAPYPHVHTAVGEWLVRAQFRPLFRDGDVTVWDRRTDIAASARRAISAAVGGVRLGDVRRVEVQIVAIGTDASLIRLTGDHPTRRLVAAASSGSLATIGAASLVASVWAPPVALLSLPAAAAATAIALAAKNTTRRTSNDIGRLLDQLAASERPNVLGVPRRSPRWRPFGAPHAAPRRPTA